MDFNTELEYGLEARSKLPLLQKCCSGKQGVDQISNLPDHIIGDILSNLPTIEAIRTSILCSRWRYLWNNITSICLSCDDGEPEKFANFVDHILQNCNSTNFLAFSLDCPVSVGVSHLNTWASFALNRNIEKLTLHFHIEPLHPVPPLPKCVITCSTIVTLNLEAFFDIEIPDPQFCFTHLKSLHLKVLSPDHDDIMHRMLSCCSVLEELELLGHLECPESQTFNISIPTLRKLSLWLDSWRYEYPSEYNIIINTPNLEYLFIEDRSSCRFMLNNRCQIREVHVDYQSVFYEKLFEYVENLFKLFRTTECLTLHSYTLKILRSAYRYTWPTFPYLRVLTVYLSEYTGWSFYPKVLYSAPHLRFLIIDWASVNWDEMGCDEVYEYHWDRPESIPNCLLHHLKIVGIKSFLGTKIELEVVEYFLCNAQVLDLMIIEFDTYPVSKEVVNKLLKFPRASKTCRVQVRNH